MPDFMRFVLVRRWHLKESVEEIAAYLEVKPWMVVKVINDAAGILKTALKDLVE